MTKGVQSKSKANLFRTKLGRDYFTRKRK